MYKLKIKTHFDAAHTLFNTESLVDKKCAELHGHRWKVEIIIETSNTKDGMVIDFSKIKDIIDKFDHKNLNDIIKINPTSENIARIIYEEVKAEIYQNLGDFTLEVTVWETPNASITYDER